MKEHFEKILGLQNKVHNNEEIKNISLNRIKTNPYQPRKNFENEKIEELAQSIKTYGLLQPIIITGEKDEFFIVAGERRYLACKMLGWEEIPVIFRDYPHSSMAAVALIENIQREDLNFLEEAQGYQRLMEEFNLTQEVLAQRLGKSQSTIANKLRLLKLPEEIKALLKEEKLSERHARALLKLDSAEQQKETVKLIMEAGMNVKETEKLIEDMHKEKDKQKPSTQSGGQVLQKKVVVRDARIFLNTVRQAVKIIKRSGLNPQMEEVEEDEYWEVRIRLPKGENRKNAARE